MKKSQIFNTYQKFHSYNLKPNSGQVVLLLVLLTVVGLTIGLSLISRTVTDIRITSQIEQSNRAFSAAEAGIETALKSSAVEPTGTVNLPGASADFQTKSIGGTTSVYYFPYTNAGKTQTLWLIAHNSDGTLNLSDPAPYPLDSSFEVCWKINSSNIPAMIMTLLYQDGSDYKISKQAFDPIPSRSGFNGADAIGGYCDGSYNYRVVITATTTFSVPVTGKLIAMRLQPVYSDTSIAINPSSSLPVQGKQIVSMGQTETGVVRKVEVAQGYFALPEIFNYTLFIEN